MSQQFIDKIRQNRNDYDDDYNWNTWEEDLKPQQQSFPSVQLALNGKPIILWNFLATAKVVRETEDMSGQKSSTKKSEKGVKSKELQITGRIPFRHAELLKLIFQLAESENGKGEQTKYRITNSTAEAINMREGIFSGEVSAVEESVQGWSVSFTLVEKDSVAEKKASQKKKPQAKTKKQSKASSPSATSTPAQAGGSATNSANSPAKSEDNEPKRSRFDEWLEEKGI